MANYFCNFSSDVPSFNSLNTVIELDTTNFESGSSAMVLGQGMFNWYRSKSDVPANLQSNYVYPTTFGYGWVQDYDVLIFKGNGIIDTSNLYISTIGFMSFTLKSAISVTAAVQTISIPGIRPGDIVLYSCTVGVGAGITGLMPKKIDVGVDQITIYLQGTPAIPVTYNLAITKADFN